MLLYFGVHIMDFKIKDWNSLLYVNAYNKFSGDMQAQE